MELKRVVNILRYPHQIKLVEVFMLGGLFLFADIVLTVWLTRLFHPFLILGLLFLTAFCGFLFSKIAYSFVYKETRTAFRESGEIPYRQFDKTLGTCVCAFLMVTPGFIFSMAAASIRWWFCSVALVCRVITSLWANRVSRSTYSAYFLASSLGYRS